MREQNCRQINIILDKAPRADSNEMDVEVDNDRVPGNAVEYYEPDRLVLVSEALVDLNPVIASNTEEECLRISYPREDKKDGRTCFLFPVKHIKRIEIIETQILHFD